jgi:predicted CopG family antitoxin
MKKCLISYFTIVSAIVLMVSCTASPSEKMKSIAEDAEQNGKNWSEDEWKTNVADFQTALGEFVRSDHSDEEVYAIDEYLAKLTTAAVSSEKASLSEVINALIDYTKKMGENFMKQYRPDEWKEKEESR